jgi:hypothetical protein
MQDDSHCRVEVQARESLLGVAALAIQARISLDVVDQMIAPFPSWGEAYAPVVRSMLAQC